jgi:hypothetical protein
MILRSFICGCCIYNPCLYLTGFEMVCYSAQYDASIKNMTGLYAGLVGTNPTGNMDVYLL